MNINDLEPSPANNRRPFKLDQYGHIPEVSGCYVLTTFEDHILYIGQANTLRRRFEQHLDSAEKANPTLEGRAYWFYWLEQEEAQLNKLERGWVVLHTNTEGKMPILNSILPPA